MKAERYGNGLYPSLRFKTGEVARIYSDGVELSVREYHPPLAICGDISTRAALTGLSDEAKIELCDYMEKRWAKLKKRLRKK